MKWSVDITSYVNRGASGEGPIGTRGLLRLLLAPGHDVHCVRTPGDALEKVIQALSKALSRLPDLIILLTGTRQCGVRWNHG